MATTLIPDELSNGLVQIIREDESYNVSYAPVLELNTIDVDDVSGDVTVFEVRSNRRTILRVDQLLLDNGAFTNYTDVQEAYDDCYNVIQSALSGIGGGGVGASDFTDLGDTFASYTGKGGKGLRIKADESGIEEYDIVTTTNVVTAQVADGTYEPGSYVNITDVQSGDCTCSAIFLVKADGYLSSTGWGSFLNAAMSAAVAAKVEYILAIDKIISVYNPATDVFVTSWFNVTGITSWALDSTTIKAGEVHDPVTLSVHAASIMTYFNFKGYNTITTASGSTFQGEAGMEATVTLGGTSTWKGVIGDNAGLTTTGTQSLTWCKIGSNKNADFSNLANTAYTRVGKTFDGNYSDFDVDNSDVAGDRLDMSANAGIIDMYSFKFAGILKVSGDATQKLDEYDFFPTDHSWTVIPNQSVGVIVLINSVINGGHNIYLETNTFITLQGAVNPVDRAVFQADEQDPSMVVKVGGANYVI